MKKQRGLAILEIILVAALLGVVVLAVYLSTQKPKSTTSQRSTAKVSTNTNSDQVGEIKSTKDLDAAIKENDAESTTDIDSDLSQIDQDLKDL